MAAKDVTKAPAEETPADEPAEVVAPVETPAPEPVAPVAAPEPVASDTQHFVAARAFAARFNHQILHFLEGDVIEHRIATDLRAKGSPIKLVEKPSEETKGAQ